MCEGCGAPLQSHHPHEPGFIPEHILKRRKNAGVCRRCFRINQYGKDESGSSVSSSEAWALAYDVVNQVDACIMAVDMLDFEGSFMPDLARMAPDKLFVAANKIDLLPSRTPPEEVSTWVKDRLGAIGLRAQGIFPVSATSGYGATTLLDAVRKRVGRGGKVGVVGATNVGKSTLLNRWLGDKENGPTVSRFAGTTVGVVEKSLRKGDLAIYDTPGLLMQGRLSERLCAECGAKLIPAAPINSQLVRLQKDRAVLLGGMTAIMPIDPVPDHIGLVFVAADVPIQRAGRGNERAIPDRLVAQRKTYLCDKCARQIADGGWEEVTVRLDEMEDLAIHGLGWLSPRRGGLTVKVTVSAGAIVSTRPRLIGPKEPFKR